MALIAWLECLSTATDRPLAVVCEFLEDIVLVMAVLAANWLRDFGLPKPAQEFSARVGHP